VRIYLDFNATAPAAPGVAEMVYQVLSEEPGNPSSIHAYGQRAKARLDDARHAVASLIGATAADLILTGGGTEAINLALRGAAESREPTGRRHLIVSAIEHEAGLMTATALERRGWRVTRLPVTAAGLVDVEVLEQALDADTALVSVMHANNEVGTIQPIAALAAAARARGALFHTDAVQTAGKVPVDVTALGVDLLSLSSHKFGGPKGTGALWIRRGVRLVPQATGGRQERSRRAGTEDTAGLAGMGVAARYAASTMAEVAVRVAALRDALETRIVADVPGTAINGDPLVRVPNTSNISFDGIEAESLLIALDLEGIAISTGSACSSGSLEPSHVLQAMGLPNARTRNSLRFSLGPTTTAAEIDTVVSVLPALVDKLRRLTQRASRTIRPVGAH
jgi:cysteine desulfurase